MFRKSKKSSEQTREDVEAIIDGAERTTSRREQRPRSERESAPYRPRGRDARPPRQRDSELSTHDSPHAPPPGDEIPF